MRCWYYLKTLGNYLNIWLNVLNIFHYIIQRLHHRFNRFHPINKLFDHIFNKFNIEKHLNPQSQRIIEIFFSCCVYESHGNVMKLFRWCGIISHDDYSNPKFLCNSLF